MSRFFRKSKEGFTLVELIVTIGIMVVILTVIARGQSGYTERLALTNLADQMSVTLRQVQTYGIAVRELTPGSADFSAAYGMSLSLLPSGSASAYITFADRNSNGAYDGDWTCPIGGTSECLEKVIIPQSNTINSICLVDEDGSEDCSTPRRVDITYVRPNTQANFAVYDSASQLIDSSTAKSVKVSLRSPNSYERLVVVYKVGQISAVEPVYSYQYPSPAYDYPTPYTTPPEVPVYQTPPVGYDLTVTKLGTGTGTVTGPTISCGSTCNANFTGGTQVTLTASPDATAIFSGWSGNCSGTSTCILTMDGSKIARATFTRVGPTVSAFDVQPRVTLGSVKATFTAAADATGNYLERADLMRAVKSATCTTAINTGCTWSVVSTSKAAKNATFTAAVNVTTSSNNITATAGGGWNAGVISVDTITSGNGYVEFTANDTANYKMAGLAYGDVSQSYDDIEYAVYMVAGGALQVYESGTYKGSFGSYVGTDIFRVVIESGVVKYYKNGVVFYTSAVAPTTYPYRFDSSFYPSTTLYNVKVSSSVSTSWSGALFNTPPQGDSYIYGLNVYDNSTPTARSGSEPAKIQVDAGDYGVPTISNFSMTPTVTLTSTRATFTAADTGGSYLQKAELWKATKNSTCTTTDESGCSWALLSTSLAAINATFTAAEAVTTSGNNITATAGGGWNAGVISVDTIASGNGYVEFTAGDTANYKMAGLGYGDVDKSYTDIEYAVYMVAGGSLYVYEKGADGVTYSRGSFGTYTGTDIFRVAIESNVVKYYKNGVVFYTSTVPVTGGVDHAYPYRFDSSFYPSTTLLNVKVSSAVSDSWSSQLWDTPASGNSYIYGFKAYDFNTPTPNVGSEPARIEVSYTAPTSNFSPDTSGTLANSLISYWKLNEASGNRSDSKGSVTLTDTNTVTSAAGKQSNAALFTAANNEMLTVADNASVSSGNIDFTLAAWVYANSLSVNRYVASKNEYILSYGGSDRFRFWINSFSHSVDATSVVPTTGTWYFIVAWHDSVNDTINIQVNNGTVHSAATAGTAPSDTGYPLNIGHYDGANVLNGWDGRIDEFGFWKKVLTAQERTDLYNSGTGNTYTP